MKKHLLTVLVCFFTLCSFAQNTWLQKGNIGTSGRKNAVAFAIGTRGYITTGSGSTGFVNDLWAYDQATGAWTQKMNFGGSARFAAVGFAIGSFGYVGTGSDAGGLKSDFYKYDTTANAWTSVAAFTGGARRSASAFATATTGYVGLGFDNTNPLQSFYSYNPVSNTWSSIAAFPGAARYSAVAAEANGKGYVGTGLSGGTTFYQDWYEYNPSNNMWAAKLDFGGGMRFEAMAFGVTGKVYVGTGYDNNNVQKIDCHEFDPVGNTWTPRADVALNNNRRNGAVGFAIGSYGYCASGIGPNGLLNDTWEYTPSTVGIEEMILKDRTVNLYPNPCRGNMTLEYELLKNVPAKFLLMDAAGKEVTCYNLSSSDKSLKITEPALKEGVYFYEVTVNDKSVTSGKILVVK